MKNQKIKLTLNELQKMLEYKNGVFYCQAIRETKDGFTVGFYNPKGYALWPTSVKEIKFKHEIPDTIVRLGNEMITSEHLFFKSNK